jgi:hypothetical protein
MCLRILGFDHGVGHPLLLLGDAKAPNCRKNKALKDLAHYAEWPKVADALIEAAVGHEPGMGHHAYPLQGLARPPSEPPHWP